MSEHHGSVAIVVGASSEIGTAVAEVFARRGQDVVLWGRDEQRLAGAAARCSEAGAASVTVRSVDVTDSAAVAAAAAEVLAAGEPVSALVWAAGVFQWGAFDEVDPHDLEHAIETSFTAAVVTARLFAPALVAGAPSHLVFIGSAAGRRAYPNNAAHVAAKHGLRGFAEALHLDLTDRGVAVTTITAGVVDAGAGHLAPLVATHPAGVLTPSDIARAVQFAVETGANARASEITLLPAATGQTPP